MTVRYFEYHHAPRAGLARVDLDPENLVAQQLTPTGWVNGI
ncbi:MAG TPA: hypothetical protein VIK54_17885 [Acidimicrobiia bacterium]